MNGFDAVLLSYDEPMANALHRRLGQVLGGTVKRLHGVRGMHRAYRLTAEMADTEQFFLAYGDFSIDSRFPAADVELPAEAVSMRVWRAVNPVNGLTYGYGGLKLIRRSALREMTEAVDVLEPRLPCVVRALVEPGRPGRVLAELDLAWESGDECAMLARGSEYGMADADARHRIDAWTGSREGGTLRHPEGLPGPSSIAVPGLACGRRRPAATDAVQAVLAVPGCRVRLKAGGSARPGRCLPSCRRRRRPGGRAADGPALRGTGTVHAPEAGAHLPDRLRRRP
ncbi:hypothetical protein [Streptomyces sp. SAJ15]|uniref:hypothetical protein n=1 Tax=Streptomyces sp. SAJ15 TaxID=2011095 RepID=UPI00164331D4|nr:hypothetical protein [Streptomyces sp. SAJ15]